MFKTYLRMFARAILRSENYTTLRVCVRVFLRMFAQNAAVISFITLASMFIINTMTYSFEEFASKAWPFFIVGLGSSVVIALQTAYEFQVQNESASE